MNKERIRNSIISILKENKLLNLATIDKKSKQPYSCCVYYIFDNDLNIYFWTTTDSDHAKNIKKNKKVSVSIANSNQEFGSMLRGVQIHGTARTLSTKELSRPARMYMKRFPKVFKFVKKVTDFNSPKLESKMYLIKPDKIKVLDEKVFGKEEHQILKLR